MNIVFQKIENDYALYQQALVHFSTIQSMDLTFVNFVFELIILHCSTNNIQKVLHDIGQEISPFNQSIMDWH